MDAVAASQPEDHDDADALEAVRSVLDLVRDAVVVFDARGRVVGSTDSLDAALGTGPEDAESFDALLATASGEPVLGQALLGIASSDVETTHARTGALVAVTARPILVRGVVAGAVATVRQTAGGEEVDHGDSVDALTGLTDLDGFLALVDRQLQQGRGDLAVVRIDIERFRELNERLGRDAGDDVLRQLSEILGRSVRGNDHLARIGGGEFAIAYEGVSESQLLVVVNRVTRSVCTELTVGGQSVAVTCNVAAASVLPGDDAASLVQRADARRPRVVGGPPMGGRPLVRR